MKRFIYSTVFAIVCIFQPIFDANAQVSYTRNVSDFDRVEIYGDIYCELAIGEKPLVRVEGIGITKEDLDIRVEGQTLRIQLKPRIYNQVEVKIYVNYQNISEIKAAGSAVLVCADTLMGDTFTADALTSATIRLQVDITNLKLKAGQGATISVKGKTGTLEASVGSKGLISGYELQASKALASCSFGGILKIHVADYLEAKASVGGAVYYMNKPKQIKVSENLGGKVEEVSNLEETESSDSL